MYARRLDCGCWVHVLKAGTEDEEEVIEECDRCQSLSLLQSEIEDI